MQLVCHKLCELGIAGKLGEWLHDFYLLRCQTVVASCAISETSIFSRIPEETVMEPQLFMVVHPDMSSVIQSATLTNYADDTKVVSEAVNI